MGEICPNNLQTVLNCSRSRFICSGQYLIISTFIFTLQGYRTGLVQRANSNSGLVLFNALVPHGSLDSDGFFGQPQPHHEQQQQQFVSNFDDLQNAQPIPAQNHHQQQQHQQQQNHSIQNGRFQQQQQQQQQQQREDGASGSKEYVSGRR